MINKITPQIDNRLLNNKQNNKSFKGAGTALLTGLGGLNDSPALGACAVDLCSMVIPRTAIEFNNRGTQAGIEASIREGSSCLLHACVGLIGFAAASLLSKGFNQQHGIKAQNIFASGETVKNMSEIWKRTDGNGNAEQFFKGFVKNLEGLNGKRWTSVSGEAINPIVENLVKLSNKTQEMATSGANKKALSKEIKTLKDVVLSQLTTDTGAQMSYKLKNITDDSGKVIAKEISATAGELIDSAVSLSNSFKTKTKEALPDFVKGLMKNKSAATVLGLGICASLALSFQPINKWLTKKRTGQDGFVGVEGDKADNSKGFKAVRTAVGVGFPIFAAKTIGKFGNLLSNVQFMSKIPTLNQFKLLYGLTIGSRFLSARDKNELRESVIKDTLGYTNWLILGGMVSKLTARALGGEALINNPVAQQGGKKGLKYAFNWISKASVKSYDEILMPKAKQIVKDGKVLPLAKMYKEASPMVKSQVKKIAASQVAGYLYSGLVLGVGIAKLNIFITKKMQERKKIKEKLNSSLEQTPQAQAQTQINNAQTTQNVQATKPTQQTQTTSLLEKFVK